MTSYRYCTACGHRHAIGVQPLRFCESCGTSFGSTTASASPAPTTPKVVRRVVAEEIEEDDAPLPVLSREDIIVEISAPQRVTIENAGRIPDLGSRGHGGMTRNDVEQMINNQFSRDRERAKEEQG